MMPLHIEVLDVQADALVDALVDAQADALVDAQWVVDKNYVSHKKQR